MPKITKKYRELQEIFQHVEQIKSERTRKIVGENVLEEFSEDDVFEIVEPEEIVTKMELGSSGICDICKKEIAFDDNLSGLVLFDKLFACKDCCQDISDSELNNWAEIKNAKPEDVKPIALWLMEQKNRPWLFDK